MSGTEPAGPGAGPDQVAFQPGPARPGLVHRLLNPDAARRTLSVNPVALGLAVGGFVLAVVAGLLPWTELTGMNSDGEFRGGPNEVTLPVSAAGDGYLAVYHLVWAALLALLVLALAGPVRLRTPLAIAGVGLSGGLVLILLSLAHAFSTTAFGELTYYGVASSQRIESTVREGLYCALIAIGLTVAAFAVAPRQRVRQWRPQAAQPQYPYPHPAPPPGAPAAPLAVFDLTVSPGGAVPPPPAPPPPAPPPPNPYGGGDNPWARR